VNAPIRYSIGYSFSSFQANSPSASLPGQKLDIELASISDSTESLRSSIADIRRSDGKLNNNLVTFDSLAPEVTFLFDSGSTTNAVLLANAVAGTAANAAAAQAANTAAQAAAAIATAGVDPAALFSGAVAPDVAINAATTTDIGNAASTRVVVNGAAVILSFGVAVKRLRLVRFNGASTLTHSAALILMTGRTRLTQAGDWGIYLSDAAGNWRELTFTRSTSVYYVEHFAAVKGDNATDDMAGIQNIFNLVSAVGGGRVVLGAGVQYRLLSTAALTDLGLILPSNVMLDMNRATFNIECTGNVYGVRMQNDSHILGPGTIGVTVSAGLGALQDIYHAPIGLGAAVGEVTSVNALGPYINATRWSIRGVRLTNVRPNGYKIAAIGGVSHGLIENPEFPGDATSVGCINFDWGTVGAINSSNVPASRALFDAGTAYTVHPNNIYMRGLKIGAMTNATSCPIRLSGCHAIRIDGFEIAQCAAFGVFVTVGDLGYEFADSNTKRSRHTGIVIRNGSILNALAGSGIYCDAYADNIAPAIVLGYVAYLNPLNPTDIVFENIRSIGNLSATAGDGATFRFMEGGTLRNCTFIGHQRGLVIADGAKRVRVEGGEASSNYQDGIYIGGSGTVPEEITVEGIWSYANAIGSVGAGINCANGKRHNVYRCRLGIAGEGNQDYGVRVDPTCIDVAVRWNHTLGAPTAAYALGTINSYGCLRVFEGNTIDPTYVSTIMTGLDIVCVSYEHSLGGLSRRFKALRVALSAGATPNAAFPGLIGDKIDYADPLTGGFLGSVCIGSGSPGSWRTFGVVS
jgi:hypothetical protein